MPELPVFAVKKERRELVKLRYYTFKAEVNYCQRKVSFAKFVSEMALLALLFSLSMIRG